MQTVAVGPFLFSVAVIALVLGILVAQAVAGWLARQGYGDADSPLWWLLLVALLVARLAHVLRYWSSYAAHPLDILNVRDGGFMLVAGLLTLAVGTLMLMMLNRRWRVSLPLALGVGAGVWGLVMGATLQLNQAAHPTLPALVLDNLDGRPVALDSFAGEPVVVNLWATWCGPCRQEMPMLAAAQHEHADVHFVFADQGESAAQIGRYLKQNRLDLQHVLVDGSRQMSQHYHVRGYPTTLFLDARGQLRDTHVGQLSRASLDARLEKLRSLHTPMGEP